MSMQSVRTITKRSELSALVKLDTVILARQPTLLAQVNIFMEQHWIQMFLSARLDSCTVKNGGCDVNAICSHDSKTNAVVCTCKTGYTNTGTDPTVICTGKTSSTGNNNSIRYVCIRLSSLFVDSCQVKNGGCDVNAICSHEAGTNAVTCTCKIGYVNVGSSCNVICKGKVFVLC